MLQAALVLLALTGQQPTQQPAAAPAKPQVSASQQADTSKAKHKTRKARAKKAKPAAAPKDTTKSKP